MKKTIFLILVAGFLGAMNSFFAKSFHSSPNQQILAIHYQVQTPADFYQKQCGFCHTSEELIAPDMNKIKNTYMDKFKTKEEFIKAIVRFVKNPDKKEAIYKDGIDNFMDMPKMPFKEAQVKAVAEYIYKTSKL